MENWFLNDFQKDTNLKSWFLLLLNSESHPDMKQWVSQKQEIICSPYYCCMGGNIRFTVEIKKAFFV